jgi:hypothetical protein
MQIKSMILFSMLPMFLIGPESDNITSVVLQAMNARYQASQTNK